MYGGDGGHRPRVEKGTPYTSTIHSLILIFLRIENKQKTLKKILFYMNSLLICISKAKVKLINMTLPYQFRKVKIVAGHPALILIIGGYTFVQLGSKSERRSYRLLERSSKTSER